MDLQETVRALKAKSIVVALNLGQHLYCPIDSNCPLAIELRRIMANAGVTLPELIEGYHAITVLDPVDHTLPEFDGRVTVRIAGRNLQLDFNDVISEQLREVVDKKLADLDGIKRRLEVLGKDLFYQYLSEIAKVKDNLDLPQLSFPERELIQTKCLITCEDRNYAFIFPDLYKPEYIVGRGIRHKLSDNDIEDLGCNVYLKFVITADNKFLSATLLDHRGRKFEHYHGNSHEDCWGGVILPNAWNGTLLSLHRLATNFMKALATINIDSLMSREPLNMPHIDRLQEHSTRLGREGELEAPAVRVETTPVGWGRTIWGAERRGRGTGGREPTRELTAEQLDIEMIRRFNTPNSGDDSIICNLCGVALGEHYGTRAEVCPRDHMVFNMTEEEIDA